MNGRNLADAAFAWRRSLAAAALAAALLLGLPHVIPVLAAAAGAAGNPELQGTLVGISQGLDHPARFGEESAVAARFHALDRRIGQTGPDLPAAWCRDLLAKSAAWMAQPDGWTLDVGHARIVCYGSLGDLPSARAEAEALARMDDRGAGTLAGNVRPRFGLGGYFGALVGAVNDDQPALASALVADGDAYAARAGHAGGGPLGRLVERWAGTGCRSSKQGAFACAYLARERLPAR